LRWGVVDNANARGWLLDRMIVERNCFIEAAGAAADGRVSPSQ
jgi:hypothetical protein